ncbi:MAG: hypothetical protein NTU71_09820 [Verrucomicrobia bacterium]|nr:hypothetical protein [Verrucomicrobiota bacterium]
MIRVARNGVEIGRHTPETLWQLIQAKALLPGDDYLEEGTVTWKKVSEFQKPGCAKAPTTNTNLAAQSSPKAWALYVLDIPGARTGLQISVLALICRIAFESYVAASINAEARTMTGMMARRMTEDAKIYLPIDYLLYVRYGQAIATALLVTAILLIPLLHLIQAHGKPGSKRAYEYWTKFFD